MEFELINIDPSIANALRRIVIAEVPTMAIEHVYFIDNTSIIMVRIKENTFRFLIIIFLFL